jgi:hypothetical protein
MAGTVMQDSQPGYPSGFGEPIWSPRTRRVCRRFSFNASLA